MKHIIPIIHFLIYIIGWFTLIWYTNNAVEAENVCKTIWGCFAMYILFKLNRKEN